MGIDAMPPPASGLPARLVLGPALRAQSDRRLVRLVREGYESAFEEIVRRYRRPLDRFAAGIVGGRSEDVTQDSFRKALEALRHGDAEVELRPWLYRIVRNTALNELRDRPPAAAELAEGLIAGGRSAAAEAEERAEVAALSTHLRALPENQRAALVMRELEGMSHEEIAAALGISHGAARQAIARGRAAVRSGLGALLPLPLVRALASGGDGAAEAIGAGAAGSVGSGAAAGGAAIGGGSAAGVGAAAFGGGVGAGALKLGLATVAVVGSIGAGVAIDHHGAAHHPDPPRAAAPVSGGPSLGGVRSTPSPVVAEVEVDHHRSGADDLGDDHRDKGRGDRGRHGGDHSGSGSGRGHESGDDHGNDHGGPGPSSEGGDGPGPSSSGGHDGGSDQSSSGPRHGGDSSQGSGSGPSNSTTGGSRSDDVTASDVGTATAAPSTSDSTSTSDSSSGSGGSGPSGSGSSGGPSPTFDSTAGTDGGGSGSGSSGGSGSSDGS